MVGHKSSAPSSSGLVAEGVAKGVAAPLQQQAQQQVDRVEGAAGEPADHGAVDADVLEIVPRVLLDEAHRALGPQRVDTPLDEARDAVVVALDQADDARLDPPVESLADVAALLRCDRCRLSNCSTRAATVSRPAP